MLPVLQTTADGSNTLFHAEVGECYHSKHGAVQESLHVFVQAGLKHWLQQNPNHIPRILEIGFGTGLNFLLSANYLLQQNIGLQYTSYELYPLPSESIQQLGYEVYLQNKDLYHSFITSYEKTLKNTTSIHQNINLSINTNNWLQEEIKSNQYDIVYFDAFSAIHQPDMWSTESLEKAANTLSSNGIFVTYSITGHIKRTFKALGFTIEKLPGAPGKREMFRAIKQ